MIGHYKTENFLIVGEVLKLAKIDSTRQAIITTNKSAAG
jgi:hypothetical protein